MTILARNGTAEMPELFEAVRDLAEKNGISMKELQEVFKSPPPGYVHPNKAHLLFVLNVVLVAITLIVVAGRFYTRIFIAGGVGCDDYMIVAATAAVLGSTALNMYGIRMCGFGKHFYDLDVAQITRLLKAMYALPIVYTVGTLLVKLSILLFYQRLFGQNKRMRRIVTWFMVFQVAFTIGTCFGYAFICRPINGWWHLENRSDACPTFKQTTIVYVLLRSVTVLCDIIVVCLPMPMVLRLEIPLRHRIGLGVLFGLGALTCIIAVARLALIPRLLLSMDVPWNILPVAILDQAEHCLGIITASLPALAAVIARLRGRLNNKSQSRGGNKYFSTGSLEMQQNLNGKQRGVGAMSPNEFHDFDFLSFAYDPDHQGTRTTAFAYGGNQKPHGSHGFGKGSVGIAMSTESDENLVDQPCMNGLNAINKTTTVTVNVSKN